MKRLFGERERETLLQFVMFSGFYVQAGNQARIFN